MSHQKMGIGLLVVGVIVLAVGVYVFMTSSKATGSAA
jgi:hypothetical protein